MKNTLFLLFLLFAAPVFSQEEGEEPADKVPYSFYEGQVVYLLADSIHVRAEPSSSSASVTRLAIGTKLTILSETDVITKLNGIYMPWYYVQFNGKKKGYVWGGKIARTSFRSYANNSYAFHFGLEKIAEGDYDDVFYQIRVEKDNKEVQRLSFQGFGLGYKEHSCTNSGNRGITTLDDVIYVDASAEYCGDGGGSLVFFRSGGKLTMVKQLWDMMDAPMFTSNYFIFPSDMEGEKGKIILHEEDGEIMDSDKDPGGRVVYSKNKNTKLTWNGSELVK